jgi:hypothetical protein
VTGHVVFLGGHDAAHQDESLVVHVTIPFRSAVGSDSESAATSFVNDLEVGARLRAAVPAVRSHCAAFVGRDHPGQHQTVTPAGRLSSPPADHHWSFWAAYLPCPRCAGKALALSIATTHSLSSAMRLTLVLALLSHVFQNSSVHAAPAGVRDAQAQLALLAPDVATLPERHDHGGGHPQEVHQGGDGRSLQAARGPGLCSQQSRRPSR